ncbi:amidase [Lysinibacillus endophyticus]|uniref:amidase n=1 Tax=Ureibacillus endophyticus TaxID=1978490 RepID=UPI0020A2002C|nr:amidase [Lysinibacillus endophyticus]MCP1146778.1 amidase [Lysinibacillus endophyticus]
MTKTISMLLEYYKEDLLKPDEVISSYLETIKEDQYITNSFIQITDGLALKELENLKSPEEQPLYGVPFTLKDCIDIEGHKTTNGAYEKHYEVKQKNSYVMDKLEKSGAICLGKTNLPEYATSVLNHSATFGDVVNCRHPNRISGGSSSGAAVSVARGLCIFAIGTDTSGSIRVPAACNEVIGFKLPYDKRLLQGVTELSLTQDHLGVLTRNITDLKEVLKCLNINTLDKLNVVKKIGIPKGYFDSYLEDDVRIALENVYEDLRASGFDLVEVNTEFLEETLTVARTIGTKEFGMKHMEKLKNNEFLSQTVKDTLERSNQITEDMYQKALQKKAEWMNRFKQIFEEIDLLLTPTLPIVPPKLGHTSMNINQKEFDLEELLVRCTSPFNILELPTISIPTNIYHQSIKFSVQLTVTDENIRSLLDFANSLLKNDNLGGY